jgi:hypothetical protein
MLSLIAYRYSPSRKNRDFLGFEKILSFSKTRKNSPKSPRLWDKKPDSVFFFIIVFFFYVEQQGKKFVEAIKHF